MNANPSGSRTALTGSLGGSEARREFAAVAEPSSGLARATGRMGDTSARAGGAIGSFGGTRRARRCVAGPSLRGAPPKEGSGTVRLPGTSVVISCHIGFFRRPRPHLRTQPVHAFPSRPVLARGSWSRAWCTPRTERSNQEFGTRLDSSFVMPSWSSTAATSYRRRPANCPEGKESWRHEHRPLVARFLVRRWCF